MSHSILGSTALLGAALLTFSLASGCSHEAPPPVVGTPSTVSPASPGKTNSSIYLSDQLRKQCGITTIASQTEAPKFAFDQSAITQEDRDVLAQVAQCLTTGPLKGKTAKLVGRADPRGTVAYNMALGERRANAVMSYLEGLGVPASELRDTSRGALDATGDDSAAWKLDRRVDIDILTP
jgi:peptidoglycan-associated lipoprotein